MELVNTNNEDSFDPTPKLKSSPIPILFISFNENDDNCIYCGDEYTRAVFYQFQKYCKKCLSRYITDITDNNIYLDVYIFTKNLECSEHEISKTKEPQNIQECCGNCLEILCFKQINICNIYPFYHHYRDNFYYTNIFNKVIESEQYCKLCGKSFYQKPAFHTNIILCSDCYLISTGYIESTLTKKPIPILYLPWWDSNSTCCSCDSKLTFTSDCQKHCTNCHIFYTGCRYCLTTNIIFGIVDQSQCKKCKGISSIIFDITNISSENSYLDDFLFNLRLGIFDNLKFSEFSDQIKKSIDKYIRPSEIYETIYKYMDHNSLMVMEWIPYSQLMNVKKIAKGGFGTIYQATWSNGSVYPMYKNSKCGRKSNENVILKRFENSQGISKDFLNELKTNNCCYKLNHHVIRVYGFTKDPELGDYILVMQYAQGGDLHNYLQNNFTKITWNKQKLAILWQISEGLETIHGANFIHRDFHSGNILFDKSSNNNNNKLEHKRKQWKVGDLGLSQSINDTSNNPNNEIYGVIPYIAPEIFKGSTFSKESDVYSIGMIMWELTTGCKPFANVEHDIRLIYKIFNGERPKITEDTPECFANLMKSCWDPDPKKRPSINEIKKKFNCWFLRSKDIEQFNKAEEKRLELINLKKLSPEFTEKPHPKAIYTSRPLSFFISKCSSINSSSIDYISKEIEFDINNNSSSLPNLNSTDRNSSNVQQPNAIYTNNLLNLLATRKRDIGELLRDGGEESINWNSKRRK